MGCHQKKNFVTHWNSPGEDNKKWIESFFKEMMADIKKDETVPSVTKWMDLEGIC